VEFGRIMRDAPRNGKHQPDETADSDAPRQLKETKFFIASTIPVGESDDSD